MTLHKHLVTDHKVSFIELQRTQQLDAQEHPTILTIDKQQWLDAGRPDVVTVEVTL